MVGCVLMGVAGSEGGVEGVGVLGVEVCVTGCSVRCVDCCLDCLVCLDVEVAVCVCCADADEAAAEAGATCE